MSGLPGLTLKDLEGDFSGPAPDVKQAVTAARSLPNVTLKDIGMELPKREIPFEGGSTLEIPYPFREPIKAEVSGPTARFLAGAGKRLTDVGLRARQLVGDKTAQQEIDEASLRDQPLMSTQGGQLGYMLPDIITGLQPRNIPNTAKAAFGYGALSGAATPLTSQEQGTNAAVLNPLVAGIGGAGAQKVLGGMATGIGKAANILPTKLAEGANVGLRATGRGTRLPVPEVPFTSPDARAAYDLAQRQGVRTSIGDIEPTSSMRSFEDLMEGVMPSRREFMGQQQEDLKRMLQTTQAGVEKPVRDAQGNVVPNTYAMAQGIKDAYAAAKTEARTRFNNVEQLATQPNVKPIIPTQTYNEAARLASERPEFFKELQDNALWKKVTGVERDAGPQSSIILQPNGLPFKKSQELDFAEVKALRSRLGSEWRSAKGQDPEKARMMATLLRALDNDIDTWGQNTGNKALNAAYEDARNFYKQNVVPYTDPLENPSKSPLFSNIALKDKVDVETVPRGVFKEGRQQLAQDFMDLSTPAGQQGAKNELIDEIIGAGLNPDTETGLSTALIRQSSRSKAPGAAVFNPSEQQAIEDAVDTLKMTRRAAGMGVTPPRTGMRTAPWAAGTALMGGAGVPLYYGLNAVMGDELTPTERVATSFVLAPLAALVGAKAGTKYTQSDLGKLLHFASPEAQSQALGTLQMLMRQGGKGLGAGIGRGAQTQGVEYPKIIRDTPELETETE